VSETDLLMLRGNTMATVRMFALMS